MIEQLLGLERCTIGQCREIAKRIGFNSTTFDLCGPKGKLPCRWLDAYMGLFQRVGEKSFMRASDIEFANDVWCENVTSEKPQDNVG